MKSQSRPDDNRAIVATSSIALALTLLLVLCTPFVEMAGVLSESQKAYRIYAFGVLALLEAALIPLRGWQRSLRIVTSPVSLLVLWCAFSLTWTQHLDLTAKRLVLLGLVYGGVFGGISDLDARRSLGIMRILLAATLALNFATIFLLPNISIHGVGLWRGFMGHKNIAGMLCALTVIVFAFDGGKLPLAARLPVVAGALVFLGFSWSKTALLTLPIALAVGGGIVLISNRKGTLDDIARKRVIMASYAAFAVAIIALLVLTVQRDLFLSFTNDTSTLTARGAIWRPMIQFYLDHPFLGSGYGAYWDASDTLVDAQANKELWKNVDQGHNGYLDLLVQVGLPGLLLALYAAFVWPMGVIADMIGKYPQRAALVVGILIFSLIENFSESSLFADDALGNAFLLIALAYVQRFALRSTRRARTEGRGEMVSAAQMRSNRQRRQQTGEQS